jgi:hypothetical protein
VHEEQPHLDTLLMHLLGSHWLLQTLGNSLPQTSVDGKVKNSNGVILLWTLSKPLIQEKRSSPVLQAFCSDCPLFAINQSIRLRTLWPPASLFKIDDVHAGQPQSPTATPGLARIRTAPAIQIEEWDSLIFIGRLKCLCLLYSGKHCETSSPFGEHVEMVLTSRSEEQRLTPRSCLHWSWSWGTLYNGKSMTKTRSVLRSRSKICVEFVSWTAQVM